MRKLFSLAAIAVLCIGIGGCSGFTSFIDNAYGIATGASVTPNQAYIAANAFDTIEATATQYLQLPACGSTASKLCRTPAGVTAVVQAIRIGRTARNNLEAAVTAANGQPVSSSLYSALMAQTTTLQQIIATYQIGQ